MLIRNAVGFIAARKRGPTSPRVSSVSGVCSVTTVRALRELLEADRLGAGGADRLVGDHGIVGDDVHAEPGRALGDRAPDRAEADDAQGLARDAAYRSRARARPVAGADGAVVEVHAAREAEQEREHVLGDLLAAEARARW